MSNESGQQVPHGVVLWFDDGGVGYKAVECPHEALGKERPCAVWANDDGSERVDECWVAQLLDAIGVDAILGEHEFKVQVVQEGYGEDASLRIVGGE